ncbi:MAG: TIGR00730 family Rossman fold protein [Verrucomicrobia bacterium]|nr:TIGR00730 family Rossman fold protein [Verrucomicrobiota bacterium]
MTIHRVCVYCASSRQIDAAYLDAANRLGRMLARNSIAIVYGGGAVGLMGQLADGALAEGGEVIGILPKFMHELEWGHPRLSELRLVNDLHERKRLMIDGADAVVALPGGSGTLDELFEAISLKRLGLFLNPIVMVNVRDFFRPALDLLERCIEERFMDPRHRSMWTVIQTPEEVIAAIGSAPPWSADARSFAAI